MYATAESQQAGLEALLALTETSSVTISNVSTLEMEVVPNGMADTDHYTIDRTRDHIDLRVLEPVSVSTGQVLPGALADTYDVPTVRYKRRPAVVWFVTASLIMLSAAWRLRNGINHLPIYFFGIAPILGIHIFAWVLSIFDKPYTVSARQQAYLDSLYVTVSIPCYNEDTGLLDRALWALINQTRPPNRIDLVNDGSTKVDYTILRQFWHGYHGSTLVTWTDKANDGKRRAHCTTFSKDPDADIFITMDSDTTLAPNAIEEGLKPFANEDVQSVAGIELGFNANQNLLTMIQNCYQQCSQMVAGAAWSVTGNMFTNRGPFALYRAPMIRTILPLYYGETFYGRRVVLGDDSLLALAGSMYGRSVQQLSAFGLTMWPENLSHHLRQRVRWARGRTIRNFWRFKYYRMGSYIFWATFTATYALIEVTLITVHSLLNHHFGLYLVHGMLVLILFSWIIQLRCLSFVRSDENFLDRALMIVLRPLASLWAWLVLNRFVRLYGTFTCLKQGWTTRQHGAEITLKIEGDRHGN